MSIQKQNKDNMDALDIKSFALERNLQPTEALQAIFQYITVSAPLFPPHLRAEPHLVDFYKGADKSHKWAHSAIEKIVPGNTSLIELHRNVVNGLSLENSTRKTTGSNLYHFTIVLLHSHFNVQTPQSQQITEVLLHDMATLPLSFSRVRSRNLDCVTMQVNEIRHKGALVLIVMDLIVFRSVRNLLTCRSMNARMEYFSQKRNVTPQEAINYLKEC
jgi:hypothetical protein